MTQTHTEAQTLDEATENAQEQAPEETTADEAQEQPEAPETPADTDLTAALAKARKDAAARRTAAKQAQAEADQLRAELEATQIRLTLTQDLWLAQKLHSTDVGIDAFKAAGHTAESVLDEAGNIDADKFAKAVNDTADRMGRVRMIGWVPSAGQGAGAGNTIGESWAEILKD